MFAKPHKLLIIGGYGTFGGRLVALLCDQAELMIFVAGRSVRKATTFIDSLTANAELVPQHFDRDGDVGKQIEDLAPDIVIDASGPFQAYSENPFRVAEAAIEVGAHYLDLADSSDFVLNISSLDGAAKRKNVFVLAGASTCPVLSSAVANHLSNDLAHVESIACGIAPSPRAGMGRSVVQAIAGYAGKPVTVIRNGHQEMLNNFVSTKNFTIAAPGHIPLPPMTFSLIDVPDLQLLAELDKPAGDTWFGVSTLPAFYHWFLRLLARGVKAGILPTLAPLAGIMHFVTNRLSWGENRSGMFVEVQGVEANGRQVLRSWHLIAEGNDGPTVPALAANLIIRKCLDGEFPQAGARPATDALTLADYQSMFADLNIVSGERALPLPADMPLFQQVLGAAWSELPAPVRNLHDVSSNARFSGRASVIRGSSLLAKMVGWFAGFPAAGKDVDVTVDIATGGERETWRRNFAGHAFSSEMRAGNDWLAALMCERFGPIRLGMALVTDGDVLRYVPRRWTFLGMPMPKVLMPNGEIFETVVDGKFVFHVEITLPFIGNVVTYDGWLKQL